MTSVPQTYNTACHSGSVQFGVQLLRRPKHSSPLHMLHLRGAVAVSAKLDGIIITQGEGFLTLYTFNTSEAKH